MNKSVDSQNVAPMLYMCYLYAVAWKFYFFKKYFLYRLKGSQKPVEFLDN
jgi:hypothetical protein